MNPPTSSSSDELRKTIEAETDGLEYAYSHFRLGIWSESEWREYRTIRIDAILTLLEAQINTARLETESKVWLKIVDAIADGRLELTLNIKDKAALSSDRGKHND